jgi:hypothetical protein
MVRMFIAFCVTILCRAPLGIGVYIVGGDASGTGVRLERRSSHGDIIGSVLMVFGP